MCRPLTCNVGLAVELPEFTSAQVLDLVGKHGLNWSEAGVEALMVMVVGHPYLIRLALYHIAQQDLTLAQLLQAAPTDAEIFGSQIDKPDQWYDGIIQLAFRLGDDICRFWHGLVASVDMAL